MSVTHKLDKAAYDAKKAVKVTAKADSPKKTTLAAVADRLVVIETVIGLR